MFFILTGGRTGSSAIVDALNRHPRITCYQELFRTTHLEGTPTPFARFEGSLSEYLDQVDGGFKLLNQHASYWRKHKLLETLKRRGYRAIFLKRRDLLSQAISLHVAKKTGVYNSINTTEPAPVALDPEGVRVSIDKLRDSAVKTRRKLEKHRFDWIEVDYEDFDSDNQAVIDRISDFLGVPRHPVSGNSYKKLNSLALVTNLEELRYLV